MWKNKWVFFGFIFLVGALFSSCNYVKPLIEVINFRYIRIPLILELINSLNFYIQQVCKEIYIIFKSKLKLGYQNLLKIAILNKFNNK